MTPERPLTTRQLADRWQVSERHLRNMVDNGTLPHFRVGRSIRIPAWAVREAEECRTQESQGSSGGEDDGRRRGKKAGERDGARSAPVIVALPTNF